MTDNVHSHAMTIKRSVDEAYAVAERDGFALLDIAIDERRLKDTLDDDSCGAFVCFEGRVRNHNNATSVERLTYYGYEDLALNQGRALDIGDVAIWVGVVSAHRYPAFDACRWILDTVKADIPVWKQEYYEDEPSKWLSNNG